jgi:hypothetical protein
LRLCYICGFSVAKERNWELFSLFFITLVEELFKQEIGPLLDKLEVATRNRNIGGMQAIFENLLLAFEQSLAI